MKTQNNTLAIYQTPDSNTSIDVKLDGDTVWLTPTQMSELFQKDRNVITRHINNVLQSVNSTEISDVQNLHIAIFDKFVKFYSLESHRRKRCNG